MFFPKLAENQPTGETGGVTRISLSAVSDKYDQTVETTYAFYIEGETVFVRIGDEGVETSSIAESQLMQISELSSDQLKEIEVVVSVYKNLDHGNVGDGLW